MLKYEELPEINSERWLSLEDLKEEEWRPVVGYEKEYLVSNYGRVKSIERMVNHPRRGKKLIKERILRTSFVYGYPSVGLKKPGDKQRTKGIHIFVASSFIDNPNNRKQIDHIDTNRKNNVVTNLRWVTAYENKHNPLSEVNCFKGFVKNGRPVIQLSVIGEYIAEYWGIGECERKTNIHHSAILSSAKKGGHKIVGGYRFVYKDSYDPSLRYTKIDENVQVSKVFFRVANKNVIVYENNKIYNVFRNNQDAAYFFDINPSVVSRRCTFNHNPMLSKKKFLTKYLGKYTFLRLEDIPEKDREEAIRMLIEKYSDSPTTEDVRQSTMKIFKNAQIDKKTGLPIGY